MSTARVLVAGAGALGSVFGGFLRRAGHDVTLLGRRRHLDAIAASGLAVDGIWGAHLVGGFGLAVEPSEIVGPFDLVLVAVKSYDTAAIAAAIRHAADAAVVVSLQNGLGNVEALAEVFGPGRVLGARVIFGAEIPLPGRARVTVYAAPTMLGSPWSREPSADCLRWSRAFDQAGIPSQPTDRILAFLWGKVLYNAPLNPLGALLKVPYGVLGDHPATRAIMDEVIDEGFRVARADGVELLWESAEACRRHFYDDLLPPTYDHRSSMLQDLERGRPTEIDAINGWICRRGEALGIPTPTNRLLTRLVKFAEERGAMTRGTR
jgi:2-dehydropantoate 2-reductase